MATRTLELRVVGDTRDVERAMRRVSGGADQMGDKIKRAAKLVAGAWAVKEVAQFGVATVKAAVEAEKSLAKTRRMVQAAGVSWARYGKDILGAADAATKLGFDDEDAAESIANLTRITKDHSEAIRLNGLAMDVARGRGIDLGAASQLVGKVAAGNLGILSRYGIQIEKGATAQEALAAIQKQFAGQSADYAKTTAGAADRASVAWENFKESIGQRVAPIVAKAFDLLTQILNRQGPAWEKVREWGQRVADYYNQNLRPAVETIGKVVQRVWQAMAPVIRTALEIVRRVVQTAIAILSGNWRKAWDNIKEVPKLALRGAVQLIRAQASLLYDAAKWIGGRIKDGIVDALKALGSAVKDAILSPIRWVANKIVSNWPDIPGAPGPPGFIKSLSTIGLARGGVVPGTGSGDSVLARLTPGEVVLNRAQQSRVGPGRIMEALSATGGLMGGTAFAPGGVVYPLAQKGSLIGSPYSGTHRLGNWQSDNAVDIRIPVGTNVLASASGRVSKVVSRGGSGRFAGTQVTMFDEGGRGFFYTHLSSASVKAGQIVSAGQVLGRSGSANGVPHLHFGVSSGSPYTYTNAAVFTPAPPERERRLRMPAGSGAGAAPVKATGPGGTFTFAEWQAYHRAVKTKGIPWGNMTALRDRYWAYRASRGQPVPGSPQAPAGGTAGSGDQPDPSLPFRAALALAGLTEDTADDTAATSALLAHLTPRLAAAQSAGDWDTVIQLAGEIRSLRDSLERNTDAVEANTVVTSGSIAFEHRGQRHLVGQSADTLRDVGVGL